MSATAIYRSCIARMARRSTSIRARTKCCSRRSESRASPMACSIRALRHNSSVGICCLSPKMRSQPTPRRPGATSSLDDGRVRLRRPLWIDLGGIAKGFAVDRALAILRAHGCESASVNAGGDLARFGPEAELVVIDPRCGGDRTAIELADRAIASSSGAPLSTRVRGRWRGAHVHGRNRHAVGVRRSVSVVAASCCVADALTKVVLADLRVGEKLLRRHGARAYLFDEMRGWRTLGAA